MQQKSIDNTKEEKNMSYSKECQKVKYIDFVGSVIHRKVQEF